MPQTISLTATARDGSTQTWNVELDHDTCAKEWTYRVATDGCNEFYEARFKEVNADKIQPDVLARNDDAFRAKGLTEALFLQIVKDSKRTLISSTNGSIKNFPNESRSPDAERVWRRLLGEERATYDAATDRYTFVPTGTGKGTFGRTNPSRRPQFYVKGSFVLDRLFGTNHANDIDIFWLDSGGQPTTHGIREWMQRCGFNDKPIQLAKVTDLFACDGGGDPIFNIDMWRIEMDGCTYEMDPTTKAMTKLGPKPSTTLAFISNLPPFALMACAATNTVLDKALAKMNRHSSLFDTTVERQILNLRARPLS
jgi:hypothetical protein